AIAGSLAAITGLTLTLDGQPVTLDSTGRATVTAGAPGKMRFAAVATDADGFTGTTTAILKVRDPADETAPAVSFGPTLGGTPVPLVREYNSLTADTDGRFGPGWRLVNRDVDLQTDAALTGREQYGIYSALRLGSRLYLTLPTGERAGFTFQPVPVTVPG